MLKVMAGVMAGLGLVGSVILNGLLIVDLMQADVALRHAEDRIIDTAEKGMECCEIAEDLGARAEACEVALGGPI